MFREVGVVLYMGKVLNKLIVSLCVWRFFFLLLVPALICWCLSTFLSRKSWSTVESIPSRSTAQPLTSWKPWGSRATGQPGETHQSWETSLACEGATESDGAEVHTRLKKPEH